MCVEELLEFLLRTNAPLVVTDCRMRDQFDEILRIFRICCRIELTVLILARSITLSPQCYLKTIPVTGRHVSHSMEKV